MWCVAWPNGQNTEVVSGMKVKEQGIRMWTKFIWQKLRLEFFRH